MPLLLVPTGAHATYWPQGSWLTAPLPPAVDVTSGEVAPILSTQPAMFAWGPTANETAAPFSAALFWRTPTATSGSGTSTDVAVAPAGAMRWPVVLELPEVSQVAGALPGQLPAYMV